MIIREYKESDELKWLDVHASVMVDSYAWWTVIHKKPKYKKDAIDLVAVYNDSIVGFITIEINSDIVKELKNVGFIWEFGVHRNYRGNNIGKMLIYEAHKIMRDKYEINKSIWYSQDLKAQKYYEKLGMKEIERHWQFSINPTNEQLGMFKKDGFICWEMRGSCSIEDFYKVKEKFKIIEDDDALKPRICIGYEFTL
jgi:ribosomal protein S18 acetylase RimI-like enzyme